MHCFLEKRKLNDSLWILLKHTNMWHVEDSACFLLRATGREVLLWLSKSLELSSSCWKGSDFSFFCHSWENLTFFKEARSAGWEAKYPACDLSLPIGARPADMAHASLLGQWDKSPAQEGGRVPWSLTLDTIPILVPCPEAAEGAPLTGSASVPFPSVCCRAPGTPPVHLPHATKNIA